MPTPKTSDILGIPKLHGEIGEFPVHCWEFPSCVEKLGNSQQHTGNSQVVWRNWGIPKFCGAFWEFPVHDREFPLTSDVLWKFTLRKKTWGLKERSEKYLKRTRGRRRWEKWRKFFGKERRGYVVDLIFSIRISVTFHKGKGTFVGASNKGRWRKYEVTGMREDIMDLKSGNVLVAFVM
ncbi:hypothetical protein K435DRAFT_792793 [Dendrothele bispora CBS 962.96]|uniref:Uncharacterized protein n=1 Tax=Dendrothele bispora (strain CBS 962.96) TaxID=1314807 RepID=A0A4S8MHH3_DENBC|nr:hypothetical protein K435DRAFT_792793 [Dendrothele bispora CBS 962.96]